MLRFATSVPFTRAKGKATVSLSRLRGRAVRRTPHDSMSLGRFVFAAELSTHDVKASPIRIQGLSAEPILPTDRQSVGRQSVHEVGLIRRNQTTWTLVPFLALQVHAIRCVNLHYFFSQLRDAFFDGILHENRLAEHSGACRVFLGPSSSAIGCLSPEHQPPCWPLVVSNEEVGHTRVGCSE